MKAYLLSSCSIGAWIELFTLVTFLIGEVGSSKFILEGISILNFAAYFFLYDEMLRKFQFLVFYVKVQQDGNDFMGPSQICISCVCRSYTRQYVCLFMLHEILLLLFSPFSLVHEKLGQVVYCFHKGVVSSYRNLLISICH